MKKKNQFGLSLKYTSDIITRRKLRGRADKLFDSAFYESQAGKTINPAAHYQSVGWKMGYNPHPLFDTRFYLANLGRPLRSNPLTDFLDIGSVESAKTHPLLDNEFYQELRPDVARENIHPLVHYVHHGCAEDCTTHPLFDTTYYREQCPDVASSGRGSIIHYLAQGWKEGRQPARRFQPQLFSRLAGLDKDVEPFSFFVNNLTDHPSNLDTKQDPENSILILNLNNAVITLQCLFFLRKNTDLSFSEIIVVDNGSELQDFVQLIRYGRVDKLIRLQSNKGFGEANNIAFGHAAGRNVVFLNNDAFVAPDWMPPLIADLVDPTVGASGPMFLYGNGKLQEAGAMVNSDGSVTQIGKHDSPRSPKYNRRRQVDYVSAATLAMTSQNFADVLGFDLCWDPAYYEDVDLCLKLIERGLKIIYNPASQVTHLEGATSSNPTLKLSNIVENNRNKFVQRWGEFLADRTAPFSSNTAPLREESAGTPVATTGKVALFTPFPLYPGGGERYLLSFADLFRSRAEVYLLTADEVSTIRIRTLGRELGLMLDHVRTSKVSDAGRLGPFDLFISIGNEVLPYAVPIGKRNYFVCQFPFPIPLSNYDRDWGKLDGYDGILVYSEYVRRHVRAGAARLGIKLPDVHILHPAVAQQPFAASASADVVRILHVGRFSPLGHSKRQDVLIDVFTRLCAGTRRSVELHLCGSLGANPVDREYVATLRMLAAGLPVFFYVNASSRDVDRLYAECDVYWHATGIGDEVRTNPERFEHFGITIVEAMSAGLVPIVVRHGGPSEIIEDGVSGFLVDGQDGLYERTVAILTMNPEAVARIGRSAHERAKAFRPEVFEQTVRTLMLL